MLEFPSAHHSLPEHPLISETLLATSNIATDIAHAVINTNISSQLKTPVPRRRDYEMKSPVSRFSPSQLIRMNSIISNRVVLPLVVGVHHHWSLLTPLSKKRKVLNSSRGTQRVEKREILINRVDIKWDRRHACHWRDQGLGGVKHLHVGRGLPWWDKNVEITEMR